ncbi:hypothetical protein [Aeromicrobium sp. Leaf350]|uniref:hypothetical protein n=1 Tax=Aeromicrobium sp. Leaf350 TaxID=2876565 RepID=UPI001E39BC1A|nr:hypothetical protein [Aeromicrobium sp. Leaf350]
MRRRPPWARTVLRLNALALVVCAGVAAVGAFLTGRAGDLPLSLVCALVAILAVVGARSAVRESEK